jgi:hypothetical protein
MGNGPAFLQQQMQQQMQQQIQQLQQLVLQQQLQKLDLQVRELAKADPSAVEEALQSPLAETRWVAARVVALKALPLQDGLIKLLTDQDLFVRQAARQGLIVLSSRAQRSQAKEASAVKRVDFGPLPSAGPAAQAAAARKWQSWWKRLDGSETDSSKKPTSTVKSSPRSGSPTLLSTVQGNGESQGSKQDAKP